MKATSYDRFVLTTGLMPDVLTRELLTKKQITEGVQLSQDEFIQMVRDVDAKVRIMHATCPTFKSNLKNSQWAEKWVSSWIENILENKQSLTAA